MDARNTERPVHVPFEIDHLRDFRGFLAGGYRRNTESRSEGITIPFLFHRSSGYGCILYRSRHRIGEKVCRMRSGGIIQHKLERHDTFTASGPHVVIVRQSGIVTGTPCRSLRIHQLLRVELKHVPLFEVYRIERIPFADKIASVL